MPPLQHMLTARPVRPHASSVQQLSHNDYEINSAQLMYNRAERGLPHRPTARMAVCVASGEVRLFEFTPPPPPQLCTVQDLLEQENVEFDNNTVIICFDYLRFNVDLMVTVGYSLQQTRKIMDEVERKHHF